MKKIKYTLIGLIGLSMTFSSCGSDFLDVNSTSTITEDRVNEIAGSSPEKLLQVSQGLVSGLYSSLIAYNTLNRTSVRHSDFGYASVYLSSDLMVDDMVQYSNNYGWFYNWYDFSLRQDIYSPDTSFPWVFYYKLIKSSNDLLTFLSGRELTLEGLKHSRGQAYAMRAFAYYNLANLYGTLPYIGNENSPSVPIALETTSLEQFRNNPRASQEAVYQLVIDDLTKALEDMATYTRPTKNILDKNVLAGLLARTYLLKEDYPNAAIYAKQARTGYSLMDPSLLYYTTAKPQSFIDIANPEWIWGADITSDTRVATSGIVNFTSHISSVSYGYVTAGDMFKCIDANLYSQIPLGDTRRKAFLADPATVAGYKLPKYANIKFGRYSNSTTENFGDQVMMRAAEMYLIEAEGLAMSNKSAEAQQVLYELVKQRNPDYVKSTKTGKDLQEEIYFQRRIELWGEGFSYFDHKRLKKGIVRNYEGTNHKADALFNYDANNAIFKYRIPSDEISNNQGIPSSENND